MDVFRDFIKHRSVIGVVVTVMTCLLTMIAAEIFLAFFHPISYLKIPPRESNHIWRDLIHHQPSSIPGLNYELTPNYSSRLWGVVVKTNSYGMRDDEPILSNDKSLKRIIVCGDSYTFGFGVSGEETYSSVLEERLNETSQDLQYDVLNMGVTGYCTRDQALLLINKGLSWDPKLVIIGYVLNDPEVEALQPLHRYFQEPYWWQHFNVLRLIAKAKFRLDVNRLGNGDYTRYLHSPEQYRWQSVLTAFEEIRVATAENNIPVLILIFPLMKGIEDWSEYPYRDLHQQVASAAKLKGYSVVDLNDVFSQHPINTLMRRDGHPNKLGHSLTAGAIQEWFLKNRDLIH
jgi:lysophospholipase L1-like esterase